MKNRKTQTFNDGIAQIFKSDNSGLENLYTLYYQNRIVGYERFFKAKDRAIRVDLMIRCHYITGLPETDIDFLVVKLHDGSAYRVRQIQYHMDFKPYVMDLSLEKINAYSDIAIASDAEFNCAIDVYESQEYKNQLGEIARKYVKLKSLMAQITAQAGETHEGQANTETVKITHKFLVKAVDIDIKPDMYFVYKENRYDVRYFMQNYKYNDIIEVLCNLVM